MLTFLNDPNIIYIIFLIGLYGLFFELYNPGLLLPGMVGVACILVALYAFQQFPTNYTGLGLLTLGMILMVVEVVVNSYGIIGFLGMIGFVFGSIFLFDSAQTQVAIPWPIIVIMGVVTAIFFFIAIYLSLGSMKKKQVMGLDTFIGKTGEVLTAEHNQYQIRILGEIWNAKSEKRLHPGDIVKVQSLDGMLLIIKKLNEI